MITLHADKCDFGSADIKEMTILGYAVYVKNTDLAKRKGLELPAFDFTLNLRDRQGSLNTAKKKGIEDFVIRLIDDILPTTDNCGDSERDYIYALRSTNESLRVLLALNGKCLDVLSEDVSRRVRRAVLRHITYLEKDNEPMGDLSWLDEMVDDSCEYVRKHLAKIGIKKHLDILINDSSPMVLGMVARKGSAEHIDIMLNRPIANLVKPHLAFNPNATDEQLAHMAKSGEHEVLLRLAERGFSADEVIFSEYLEVRVMLAKNCNFKALMLLALDSHSAVREEVVWRGAAVELLKFDSSASVRQAVANYKAHISKSSEMAAVA